MVSFAHVCLVQLGSREMGIYITQTEDTGCLEWASLSFVCQQARSSLVGSPTTNTSSWFPPPLPIPPVSRQRRSMLWWNRARRSPCETGKVDSGSSSGRKASGVPGIQKYVMKYPGFLALFCHQQRWRRVHTSDHAFGIIVGQCIEVGWSDYDWRGSGYKLLLCKLHWNIETPLTIF